MSLARARKRAAATGRRGEKIAAGFLVSRGMTVLHRNFRCRAGELDIVALDGGEIVFVEVKTMRYRQRDMRPWVNLSANQRRHNRNAGKVYLKSTGAFVLNARYDLVEVILRGAFCVGLYHTRDYQPPLPALPEEGG